MASRELAAIANLPVGWLLEHPRGDRETWSCAATGPDGDEFEVSGRTAEEACRAMAESLAAMGESQSW